VHPACVGTVAVSMLLMVWRALHRAHPSNRCLQTLIAAALVATVDKDVRDLAEPFARGVCTHLALLYACGNARSQQEHGVSGSWSSSPPYHAPCAPSNPHELNMRAAFQGLLAVLVDQDEQRIAAGAKAVDMFVTSLLVAAEARRTTGGVGREEHKEHKLSDDDAAMVAKPPEGCEPATARDTSAADDAAGAHVEGEGMKAEESGRGGEEHSDGCVERASAADGTAPSDGDTAKKAAPAAAASSTPRDASAKHRSGNEITNKIRPPAVPERAPSRQTGLPHVLDDLMSHVLHACHGNTWGCCIGGISGLKVLTKRLPREYLKPWSAQLVAAISKVLSALPEHSTSEVALMSKLLREVVLNVAIVEDTGTQADAASEAPHTTGGAGDVQMDVGDDAPATSIVKSTLLVCVCLCLDQLYSVLVAKAMQNREC
jgi:hypothetical protein